MLTNEFFGLSRRKFSDAELKWLGEKVATFISESFSPNNILK